ncbi:RNA polymerase sigma factor [Roseibacillus ishigakijimensis]|uniref:Sigma-70 family RNA polymerase sigma factor n=1 Tax=Roseibacillus ishigakijimensis TaxID=454146 RepID=A0A934VMA0_9BACT|nr:sigma-70 family RNA polymerase sigma factor [Roseibacillus ishigakijimensis]MBK1834062.1 sigma-70 family RNA polymerase sigma factor [Roseibacillus ishigakijimensis]
MAKDSGLPAGAGGEEAEDAISDLDLVARCQGGDSRAFADLVARHRGRVYAMIQNMVKNEADAWDLSQEVFVKVWKALPRFEARAKFTTWLYRIVHNVVYDWMRKRKLESAGEFDDQLMKESQIAAGARTTPTQEAAPDQALRNEELRGRIEEALAKLSPEHQEVILLREVQGLDYKEIAEVMEISLGTVMSRLFYARKKLQGFLSDETGA